MVKIALCDDNHIFLQELKAVVKKHVDNCRIESEIYTYSDGRSFIKAFNKDKYFFDIIFLDIIMPGLDGIEVAQELRIYNKNVLLVFLTSKEDRVYEAFKFNTFRFIRKNYVLSEINECLDKAFKLLESEQEVYSFKTKDGLVRLSIQEILYFTYINRHVEIKALNNQYLMNITRFKDIVNQFKDKNFVSIHRGCIVNVKYIKAINKLFIILDNDEKLSISRYKVDEVFRAFTNYAR